MVVLRFTMNAALRSIHAFAAVMPAGHAGLGPERREAHV